MGPKGRTGLNCIRGMRPVLSRRVLPQVEGSVGELSARGCRI